VGYAYLLGLLRPPVAQHAHQLDPERHGAAQHGTARHSTAQHSTHEAQWDTQHGSARHSGTHLHASKLLLMLTVAPWMLLPHGMTHITLMNHLSRTNNFQGVQMATPWLRNTLRNMFC
jgi:hypothetical protein